MSQLITRSIRAIESFAPLSLASTSWDNVGLLVDPPYPRSNTSRIFLTIDLTLPVLREALSDPSVGIIIAYHPTLFKPIRKLSLSNPTSRVAMEALAAGVAVYSPHTALDACAGGINDWLAQGLGLGSTKPIQPLPNDPRVGEGRIHTLDNTVSLREMIKRIKDHLNLPFVRVAVPPQLYRNRNDNQPKSNTASSSLDNFDVKSVAICAGSGASVLGDSAVDLFLTGEMSHHEVLAALAQGTAVILCEHTNTERGYLKVRV